MPGRASAGWAAYACWLACAGCSLLIDSDSVPCTGGSECGNNPGTSSTSATVRGQPTGGGTCTPACASPQPICDSVRRECVECMLDSDCAQQLNAPLCDPESRRCVQCETAGDCAGVANLPRCELNSKACVQCVTHADCAPNLCEPNTHTCVGCVDDEDCKDPKAARCDTATRTCVGCSEDANCSHVIGLSVCEPTTAQCVECTAQTEDKCGGSVCDLRLRICASRRRGTRELCGNCEFDSDCPSGDKPLAMRESRCIGLSFKGKPQAGGYCLTTVSKGCLRPYTTQIDVAASSSGAGPDRYCGIDQSLTTCEAVRAASANTPCARDADCGAATLDDGLCTTVGGAANRCSNPCTNAMQCASALSCTDNHCQ